MNANLQNKKQIVAQVAETIKDAQTLVIAEYHNIGSNSMTVIRKVARENNVYLHVVKNTLVRKAVEGTKFAPLAEKMSGPLIYAVSVDPVAAAKVINEFAKANDKVAIIAGMYNEKLLDVAGVKQLASIPSREELLATVMGVMQQIPASFVRLVAAIKDKKESSAA